MPTDTTGYPVFTSKEDMLREIWRQFNRHPRVFDILRRISNTDTSSFADPTYELPEVNPS